MFFLKKYLNKKYSINLFFSYAQVFVSILITILLTPYMIEKLGSTLYGYWILLNSILLYLSLSNFGFTTAFLKKISSEVDNNILNQYISTIFYLFFFIGICIVFLLFYLSEYLNILFVIKRDIINTVKVSFFIFAISFYINFISSIFETILFAKGYLYIKSLISILHNIISALAIVYILSINYSIVEMYIMNLCISLIFFIVIYITSKLYVAFSISYTHFNFYILKKMFIQSKHYFIIALSAIVILYSDNIIISAYISLEAVTIYAIGYKIVDISQTILFKIVDILIPDIAFLYEKKEYVLIQKLHNKILFFSTLLALIGYGILFMIGTEIIEVWIGVEYTLNKDIFSVFLFFGLWHSWVHVSAVFNIAMGNHEFPSYMGILNAFLNIILSILLLEHYGLFGIALGTLLSHILTNGWFSNYWFYKTIKNKIRYNNEYENK